MHQDLTDNAIFSFLAITLLNRLSIISLLDVGCGLGYMSARLKSGLSNLTGVVGMNITTTANAKAFSIFPDIEFITGSLQGLGSGVRLLMLP